MQVVRVFPNVFTTEGGSSRLDMNKKEVAFLNKRGLARLATASKDLMPHVIPIMYAMDGEKVIVAVDYETRNPKNLKRESQGLPRGR